MLIDGHGRLPLPWLWPALQRALGLPRAHAVMLHADPGDGALELVACLAQSWLCESPLPDRRACGHCVSCQYLHARTHPDMRWLLPESLQLELGWADAGDDADEGSRAKARKPSRQLRIEAVRSAIDWTARSATRGGVKVVALHPAEALNPQSGNALLKTLEEPPPATRMILTSSEPNRVLPTIRSRCQMVRLETPGGAEASDWLQSRDAGDGLTLLRAAGGHPLEALALARTVASANDWNDLPARLARGQAFDLMTSWGLSLSVAALLKVCHDCMAVAVGGEPRYFDAGRFPRPPAMASLCDWQRLLVETGRTVDHPWNETLRLEYLASSALATWQGRPLDTLQA
jgi:DNA polymerase-3 subunit delta'